MKLDVNVLRYLSKDDFRTLTAVEMGQKNHELVPMPLIDSIAGLKHGGAFRSIKILLRHKLVHHENQKYDGYRLTYMGYDYLAIRALTARGHITGVGRQIGVGKESDIFEVMNDEGEVLALKLHRLGRTSFRAVKSKRDYLGKRTSYSWLYLSRLAALKEFAFMKALGEHGFPVPQAIDSNRHAVLMSLVDAQPLVQVKRMEDPAKVYLSSMELISRLASKGLIHCDFNEFNLLISPDEELTLIDFPQMVSVHHANAQEYFDRDVECIVRFFTKKVCYIPENDPELPYVRPNFQDAVAAMSEPLDVDLAASGFQTAHQEALEAAFAARGEAADADEEDGDDSGDEEDEVEDESEEGGAGDEEAAQASHPGAQHTSPSQPHVLLLQPHDPPAAAAPPGSTQPAGSSHVGEMLQGEGCAAGDPVAAAAQGAGAAGGLGAGPSQQAHDRTAAQAASASAVDGAAGSAGQPSDSSGRAFKHQGVGQGPEEEEGPASSGGSSGTGADVDGPGLGEDGVGPLRTQADGPDGEAVRRAARRAAGSVAGSVAASSAFTHTLLGEREVQAMVVEQRKRALKAAAMQRASRNSSKAAKGKGSSKGGKGAGAADFGGW